MWFSILIGMLASYLLGNLNGAVCMSALHHDDVRSHGSGNAGLTNFIRNYGVGQAIYVILIDAGKAALACLLTGLLLAPYGLYTEGTALGNLAAQMIADGAFADLAAFRAALPLSFEITEY